MQRPPSLLSINTAITTSTSCYHHLRNEKFKQRIAATTYLSPEWHQHRNVYVGASQLAAIIGISEYTSLKAIYLQKHYGIFPQQSIFSLNALQHGTEKESEAFETLKHVPLYAGKQLTRNPGIKFSKITPLLGASVDVAEQIEIKSPYIREPFTEVSKIPVDNVLQAAAYCHCYAVAYWDIFYYWSEETYAIFRVSANEEFFVSNIIPAVLQFCSGSVDVEINRRRKGRKGKVVAAVRAAFPCVLVFASF